MDNSSFVSILLRELVTGVRINRKAAERLAAGHPWIFRGDVIDIGTAQPGEVACLITDVSQIAGFAHYSSSSKIALRYLSRREERDRIGFFRARLAQAAAHRRRWVNDSSAFRLVYAEADFLPALIVDRYADYLAMQALDQGMDRETPAIVAALNDLFDPAGILARNDAAVRSQESLPRETAVLSGTVPDLVTVRMNGLLFEVNLHGGMKTGLFLDQRENYVAAARYAHGAALDCFTSTGGFALHLAARCERVDAIDSSERAIRIARANADANGIANIAFREADVGQTLAEYAAERRQFDTIVLDPPAFAKSRSHVDRAARVYKELNRRALRVLAPGGTFVTCSCSHHLSEAHLLEVVAEAALETGRTLCVLERRTQALDHPVLLTVPETMYLKCLIFASI